MSQYFFVASPGHPVVLLALHTGIQSLKNTVNVMVNSPAWHTGPNAIKVGFILFQKAVRIKTNGFVPAGIYDGAMSNKALKLNIQQQPAPPALGLAITHGSSIDININNSSNTNTSISNSNVTATARQTVTMVGDKNNSDQIVNHDGLKQELKREYMHAHGMPHYNTLQRKLRQKRSATCQNHITSQEEQIRALNLTLPVTVVTMAAATSATTVYSHYWYPQYQVANYSTDGWFVQ